MKKLTALLLSLLFVFALAACSGQAEPETTADESASATQNTKPQTQTTESSAQTKKTLVVYFSATGNTKRVAREIASAANADIFEIVPKEAYTSQDLDWTNSDSRVSREHENESLRDVELAETTAENWGSYDTVFIGYPIWWGVAAWPMSSFVKNNDFSKKTVIPFATSSSSSIGESAANLEKIAGNGNWRDGQRFSSSASTDEIQSWVNGLEL